MKKMRLTALLLTGVLVFSGCGGKKQEELTADNFSQKSETLAKSVLEQEQGAEKKEVSKGLIGGALGAAGGADRMNGKNKKAKETSTKTSNDGWGWLDAAIIAINTGDNSELANYFSGNVRLVSSLDEIGGGWDVKTIPYGRDDSCSYLTADISVSGKKAKVSLDLESGSELFSGSASVNRDNGCYLDLASDDHYMMITDFLDDNGRQYAIGMYVIDENTVDILGFMRTGGSSAKSGGAGQSSGKKKPASDSFAWFDALCEAAMKGEDTSDIEQLFKDGTFLAGASEFSGEWNCKAFLVEDMDAGEGSMHMMSFTITVDGEEAEVTVSTGSDLGYGELVFSGEAEYEEEEGSWYVEAENDEGELEIGWFCENSGVQYAVGAMVLEDAEEYYVIGLER
ncbi:MAG: hypothetical protein K6B72_05080 [Lachnospiraceae bacterium]|nr:hypothetical protein [Lachnospiraceae bacterium]